LTVPVGDVTGAEILDGMLEDLLTLLEGIRDNTCASDGGGCPPMFDDSESVARRQTALVHAVFEHLVNRVVSELRSSRVLYRAEPGLVARYSSIWGPQPPGNSADIINNSRRALMSAQGDVLIDRELATTSGIAESVLEEVLLPMGAEVSAARRLLESDGEDWLVVRPGEAGKLEIAGIGARQKRAMANDLAAGYALILDRNGLQSSDRGSWWRLDPQTGNALGMLSPGIGGAFGMSVSGSSESGEYQIVLRDSGKELAKRIQQNVARGVFCLFLIATLSLMVLFVIGEASLALAAAAPIPMAIAGFIASVVGVLSKLGLSDLMPLVVNVLKAPPTIFYSMMQALLRACMDM
jgi:hypothetical protein